MEKFSLFLGISLACMIAYHDFRYREIHTYLFILFLSCGIGVALWKGNGVSCGTNLILVGVLSFLVLVYYRLKDQTWVIDTKIGLGDFACMLALAPWFHTEQFVWFFAISLFATCFVFLFLQGLRRIPIDYPIPLAGALCICFIVFMVMEHFSQE